MVVYSYIFKIILALDRKCVHNIINANDTNYNKLIC